MDTTRPLPLRETTAAQTKRYAKIIAQFAADTGLPLESLQPETLSVLNAFYRYFEPCQQNIFVDGFVYGHIDAAGIGIADEARQQKAAAAWIQYRDAFLRKPVPTELTNKTTKT